MQINYLEIIAMVINFAILVTVIIVIHKAIQAFKNFTNRNKEIEKKIDVILNKLENKKEN
jgi:F0F1-type ATP synthase membrane subunit b/b'